MKKIFLLAVLLFGVSGGLIPLYSQLKATGTIASGMVVQRQQPIPLRGEAAAGALISAEMNGSSASAQSGANGSWEVLLPPLEAGGPYDLKIWSDGDTLRLHDIYVGDVWLASGQSNMAWPLKDTDNATAEIAGSENPRIRQYLVPRTLTNEKREQPPAGSEWMQAGPEHSGLFTAVGYYFAKYLYQHLDIPIGIINSSYGGSRIESWISEEALGYDEQDINLGENNFNQATVCYNAMMHPLIHTPVKGVIWYQGESNMGSRENAVSYTNQLETLIGSWRKLWDMEELPFIWVQLPNIGTEANENSPGTWDALPMLRAAMSRTLSLPHTGEVTAIDLGGIDIHPTVKEPLGERLSLVARTLVYGDSIESSGPRYRSHRKMGAGRIEISFDHTAGGLVASETGDQSLRWFSLAGSNGTYYKANALIVGDKVEVWNPGIANPVYLRYAWEHNPYNTNFYNSEDLAATPFKVRIDHPGFKLQSFKSTDYHIDKGESTQLTWEWSGAERLSINGIPADSIGGWRVWPENDSTFTIKAFDRLNPAHMDSATITIKVRQPDPTIEIFASGGDWLLPGREISIRAIVSTPLGGSVALVEFYANNTKLAGISEPPYAFTWTPESTGEVNLHATVTSQAGMSTKSDSILKLVDHFETQYIEAEEADLKGGRRIMEDEEVSGGKYVDLTRDWTISFPAFQLDSTQTCQLSFYSLLNYGSPRVQDLYINEEAYPDQVFKAPDTENWVGKHMLLDLDSGSNLISLKSDWGYISLDYLEIFYRPSQSRQDTTTSLSQISSTFDLRIYPNPFRESSRVSFSLPGEGDFIMDLYDMAGRKVVNLLNTRMGPGKHSYDIRREGLTDGTYILYVNYDGKVFREKLIIQ